MKILLSVLFNLFFIPLLVGQSNHHKISSFKLSDGLSNTHVNCIVQDAKGFIWIGTEDGLNRFDGKHFENYFHYDDDSLSLPSSAIYALFIDNNSGLWIGTFAGLCRYDYHSESFRPASIKNKKNNIITSPVKTIVQGKKDELWLGTSGDGLINYNTKSEEATFFKHKNTKKSIASNYIAEILLVKNQVWVGTQDDGLSILDTLTNTFSNLNVKTGSLQNNTILALFKDENQSIWVGTFGGGVSIFNTNKELTTIFKKDKNNPQSINSNIVYDIKQDKNKQIWIATEGGGLIKYNRKRKTFTKIKGLINNKVRAIFEDVDGNLWLAIHQGGVNFISKESSYFSTINKTNFPELTDNSILAIYSDNNKLWIGTDGGGLNIYELNNHLFENYTKSKIESIKSKAIRAIYRDSNKDIWIGTYLGGLSKIDSKNNKLYTYRNNPNNKNSLSSNDVTCIAEDRLGFLWFGTNGGGLNRYNKKTGQFKHFKHNENKNSIISDWIITLYVDRLGYIWIGTYWGFCKIDPITYKVENYKDNKSKNENAYFCFHEDAENRFWGGTWSGLKLINKESGKIEKTFTIKEGLPNNVINGILEDRNGNLWISTNNGLSCFNYKKQRFKNFNEKDGLQSNEFIHGAYAKGNNGEMYFGGINGVSYFFPDSVKFSNQQPKVILTDFLIFNKSVPIGHLNNNNTILNQSISETKTIHLKHNDNSFTFNFSAIEFNLPEKVQFACRMKGFNDKWNYYNYKKNSLTYTNLDYGTYFFEIKATNNNEVWGETRSIKIIINSPIWLRWWAFLIYFISLSAIIYFIWKNYQFRLSEKNKIKVERLKRQKDKEIDQAKLQFFTNISHEFRTPLTLILGPLESMIASEDKLDEKRKKHELMYRNANRLLRLINQLMDLRKLDNGKVKLQASKQDIISFINEIHDNFKQIAKNKNINFTLKKEFSELELWFDTDKMDKIFFNLLSNAFKFTPENGKISIEVKNFSDPNFVEIKVVDTGIGISEKKLNYIFERFYQTDSKSNLQQGSGIGLWLTKNYIELHSGKIEVSSQKKKGTSFTLILPKGNRHLSHEQKVLRNEPTLQLQPSVFENTHDFYINGVEQVENEKKQTILLVEDDDEIRNYIKEGLTIKYNIKEAINGLEGLNSAKEILPDLVITDVMMPEMDGIELCKRLKTDIETCHIPVIMLTAKTSIEHRIEGLKTGADSYIPKPFNPLHLTIRIEKLLELRKILINKFNTEIGFAPEKMAMTSSDDKLLQKAIKVVKDRISDTSLNVETLSQDMAVSRGHLQRKLKSLTGHNPNEFIRIMRLKQAAEILSTNEITVSEVAYMVGFSSPSYFSTCFTKQYKLSPKQYLEQLKK